MTQMPPPPPPPLTDESPSILAVQEKAWRSREARMQRIVAAWETRVKKASKKPAAQKATAAQPKVQVKQTMIPSWREKWPKQFPSRSSVRKDTYFDLENGRAAGLADFCRKKCVDAEAFYVVDVGCVEKLFRGFTEALPRVRPYYAVKCFPNVEIVKTLAALGAGFDCASRAEADLAHKILPADDKGRIIFANPCKRLSDVEFIAKNGDTVPFTTFDSVCEINKIADAIKKLPKRAKSVGLVLRIRADDPQSRLPFGAKYGATLEEIPELLKQAKLRDLKVVGVSFHVGSGARTADAYRAAVKAARNVKVDEWKMLDVGGGMCGDFDELGLPRLTASGDATLPRVLNESLEEFFPASEFPSLQIIAEPGRYFAEASAALCAKIIGKRSRPQEDHFWISDGVYGAFNAILYDAWLPHAVVLAFPSSSSSSSRNTSSSEDTKTPIEKKKNTEKNESPLVDDLEEKNSKKVSIFGPTCDSLDMVFHDLTEVPLSLDVGSWLLFPNCGAYTHAGATNFNGIPACDFPVFYVRSKSMAITNTDRTLNVLYGKKPPAEIVRYFD